MRRMFPADRPTARRGQLELRCIPGYILAETIGIPVLSCGCLGRISTVAPPLPEPGTPPKNLSTLAHHLHCASISSFDCIQPLSGIPAASDGLFLTLVQSAYLSPPSFPLLSLSSLLSYVPTISLQFLEGRHARVSTPHGNPTPPCCLQDSNASCSLTQTRSMCPLVFRWWSRRR
jgi:hypothetical protein